MSEPGHTGAGGAAAGHDVVLVRHGQTGWSREGKHTGRTDLPLTQDGREQALSLGESLREHQFAAVFSSPLIRAWETMQLAGLSGETVADLAEWDYGDYEGRRTADIRRQLPDWSVWTHPIPNGESLADVGGRADRVLDHVLEIPGPVALFSHAHFLRVLAARWLQLPPEAGRLFTLSTATVSVLGWEREQRVIKHWNEPGELVSTDPLL